MGVVTARKHPVGTYVWVWTCDAAALAMMITSLRTLSTMDQAHQWLDLGIWALMVCAARLGVITLVGLSVNAGWFTAIEFSAALVLPFPLFCLGMLLSFVLIVARRLWRNHPEPFLGPDFNAANATLAAAAAKAAYHGITSLEPFASGHGSTVGAVGAAFIFFLVHTLLLTILLAIDERKPWRKVGCLDADALISDAIMLTAGALLGRMYQEDRTLLALTLVPLLFLHKALGKLNEAKLAYVDGKTGLYNYRFLDEVLNDRFRKAVQARKHLALIFGDMDHLRDVNNMYGHQAGDRALLIVADAFRREAQQELIAARFGGEEFVLVLPGYNKVQAAQVAERIRLAVATTPVAVAGGGAVPITLSLGVAAYPEDAATLDELVKAADESVYQAKHAGRNRVCLYVNLQTDTLMRSGSV